MRIVLIGANGNVGTEIALRLAARSDLDLIPVCRRRGGSVYLRYKGVPCLHADITDPASAPAVFRGATVIASLALPLGDPARVRETNRRIFDSILKFSPKEAVLVFFSTLAVVGQYDMVTRVFAPTQYGRWKKWAETYFLRRAMRLGRRAYAIRLGHVAGDLQPLSRLLQEDIKRGPITVIEENRPSNLVHTVMVAELLRHLASGSLAKPGRYDLVNNPNWTWREAYEYEARSARPHHTKLQIVSIGTAPTGQHRDGVVRSLLASAIRSKLLERHAPRVLEQLPLRFEEKVRALYLGQLVRNSIAGSHTEPRLNPALYWPPLGQSMFPGLGETWALLPKWPLIEDARPWAPDLEV